MSENLKSPKYYFNRELSWIKFNERVLEEAEDSRHPLLERLKFISIFSSNLDEFYMIRVSGLNEQVHANIRDIPADGLPPRAVLNRISAEVHQLVAKQASILEEDILPKLKRKGIRIRDTNSLRKPQSQYLADYFREKIFPVLTPMAIDSSHPFPILKNLSLNLMVQLRESYKNELKTAVVPIPGQLPRFIPLPSDNGKTDFVILEDVMKKYVDQLFPKLKILDISEFRITRNADLQLAEAEADDLLKFIEREIRKRRLATVIRLEVSREMPESARQFLMENMDLTENSIYESPTYLGLSAFMSLMKVEAPEIKDQPFLPAFEKRLIKQPNIFKAIREGDIILHHPYDSFNHVIDFVSQAAEDPKVLAIKQTLYRTSGNSPIVSALKKAVENGKSVTALIELKARFDEENNISWAKDLEETGVNVIYGLMGLKTHCKISMVVRQEGDSFKRYLHLSTGNYNATTAKIYTDLSLFTTDKEMGEDASGLFNLLTGFSQQEDWNKFLVAPATLRKGITKLIKECVKNHKKDTPARIIMVMNSLVDPDIIQELYKASMKGIKIELIIRGICCLKPGIPEVSENITVKSIVGRFLEHCRIFYFKHSGKSTIYMGSADLMQRNLNRRVELVFPVEDPKIKHRVRHIIQALLDDNEKSRYLDAEGKYGPRELGSNAKKINVQEDLLKESKEKNKGLDTIIGIN